MEMVFVEELDVIAAPVTAQDAWDFLQGVAVGIAIGALICGGA
jgi:hypothetical protein